MRLRFADKSSIEIKNIFGSYKMINGVLRDTLRIEIDPSTTTFDELCSLFKNNPNLDTLFTVNELDDGSESVSTIGEGYNVFVSISNERIKTSTPEPGKIEKPTYEDIFVVQIAQQTYEEYTLSKE